MMADKKEILMRIGDGGAGDVTAECQAALRSEPADPLMRDFRPGQFFEIKDFSLSIGLHDKDAPTSNSEAAKAEAGERVKADAKHPGKPHQAPKAAKPPRKFAEWRDGRRNAPYPLEVQPISFSRIMDRASTTLLQDLCQSKSYASATIVRRMGTGSDGPPRAFLRLDFTCVLMTSVDWNDEDLIKEQYKFICQKVEVQYKPQQADGFLGPLIRGKWPKAP